MGKRIYYLCFISGGGLLILSQFMAPSSLLVSLAGLILLMSSLYQLSKGVGEKPDTDSYVVSEEEE
jgi:uncharacterized membrane protein